MASFTAAGDNTTLTVADKGEQVSIALSGTYAQTVLFQRENGSPGSGSWQLLKTYSTANATVADSYYTESFHENLRLIASAVTSGTCVATLTNTTAELVRTARDSLGNVISSSYQGSFVPTNTPVSVTAVATLTRADHAYRAVKVDNATGFAITLPAASGSGDKYFLNYVTSVGSGSATIVTNVAADKMAGMAIAVDNTIFTNAGTATTLTFNGSTTGGLKGTVVELCDVATNLWIVKVFNCCSGAEATPFS